MSTIFGATAFFPLRPPASPGVILHQSISWRSIVAPWALVRLWTARHSQRGTLGVLAEEKHLLDDIGLTRAQALHEAGKPFWRP
jgi:uncharacterized protein YjiS (DUF1127 family)